MAVLTIRKVPDDVHRALRTRATRHGRSVEAEVREILAAAVKPEKRVRMGDALAALGVADEITQPVSSSYACHSLNRLGPPAP